MEQPKQLVPPQASRPKRLGLHHGERCRTRAVDLSTGTTRVAQLTATRPFRDTGGVLEVTSTSPSSSVTNLELTGGTIGGSGKLELLGQSNWSSGELDTGTLPSGATLYVYGSCEHCASIGSGGTLNVAGGNLTFVGGATLYMKGSAKLLNSGTVNFDSDGGGITAETSAATVVNSSGGVFEDGRQPLTDCRAV